MRAYVHEYGELKVRDVEEPSAKEGEVVVALKTAGINRRDINLPNRLSKTAEALVLGSDGAGIIESIGENVKNVSVGDEVIINPSLRWNKNSDAPPEPYDILGSPDNGTFAEKVVVSSEQVENKPAFLSWEEAGVLALSALTGYRALFTKGKLKETDTVFIPGASSGVATYIISFAKNIGARVIVSSRNEDKRQQALKLGADLAIDTNGDWEKALKNETIDLVIESVGRATFNKSLSILKKGGRIVVFGATTEDTVGLNLRDFFYGQFQLFGSTMGSREELREMLAHIEKYQTKPVIDKVYHLKDAPDAFEYVEQSQQFGKVALTIN